MISELGLLISIKQIAAKNVAPNITIEALQILDNLVREPEQEKTVPALIEPTATTTMSATSRSGHSDYVSLLLFWVPKPANLALPIR
jgi:hypothetical protein